MRPPTFYFQMDEGPCKLLCKGNNNDAGEVSINLPSAGVHWQGRGNQLKGKHRTIHEVWRLVVSLRASPRSLQETGWQSLLSSFPKSKFAHCGSKPDNFYILSLI